MNKRNQMAFVYHFSAILIVRTITLTATKQREAIGIVSDFC